MTSRTSHLLVAAVVAFGLTSCGEADDASPTPKSTYAVRDDPFEGPPPDAEEIDALCNAVALATEEVVLDQRIELVPMLTTLEHLDAKTERSEDDDRKEDCAVTFYLGQQGIAIKLGVNPLSEEALAEKESMDVCELHGEFSDSRNERPRAVFGADSTVESTDDREYCRSPAYQLDGGIVLDTVFVTHAAHVTTRFMIVEARAWSSPGTPEYGADLDVVTTQVMEKLVGLI
ncbi:hypothetical protein [Stackebrandtia soli]|uniref:hypothetical protein n=1 Tax=Stackebrandtia soli TaxID=1892856 RepID=UPI0039ECB8CD